MLKLLSSLLLAAVPCCYVFAIDTQSIEWNEVDHHPVHGDFNADGKLDSLIVSKSPDTPSYLFSDVGGNNTVTEHWVSFNANAYFLVSGDFDNDQQDEVLVLDRELSGYYWDFSEQDGFYEGSDKLKFLGYSKNRQINFTHLYTGYFNSDDSADLIAYSQDTNDIVVFHNRQKTNKIKFKYDAELTLDNSSSMELKISDFNGDGLEDIVLLSTASGGSSYAAFAGNKGKFKKSEFVDISSFLNGHDWSTEQHSYVLWSDASTGERQLIRLANANGGIDEEGNIYLDAEPIEENSEVNIQSDEGASCEHLAYSPLTRAVTKTCMDNSGTDNTEASGANGRGLFSAISSRVISLFQDEPDMSGLATTVGVPASVSAYNPPGTNDIKISWSEVTGATSYNREVSLNGGGWQNKKTYPGDQTYVWFYDQQVRSYRYRVRACDGNGCNATWRESNSVTIHPTPTVPSTPSSYPSVSGGSYHPVNSIYTVNVNSVVGATYYQVYVGTSSSNVSYQGGGSGYSHNVNAGSNYGYRYIKYKACNSAGCSGLSPYKRIYVYTTPGGVNNQAISATSLNVGQSATISWTKAGGMTPSGYYRVEESKPGQGYTTIGNITAGYGSSYSTAVTPSPTFGTYTYRLRACNPNVGCGGSRYVTTALVNRSPIADDESLTVEEGKSVTVNVIAGDTDPDGHTLSISGYTNGNKGTVSCSGNTCTYTSTTSIAANATDSFTYTVSDGFGGQDVGTVSVTIINLTPTVTAPTISPTGRTFSSSQSISISTPTSGAIIYYTLDGSTPNTSSTRYTGSFDITYDVTIKAFATKSGYLNSSVDTEVFTRNRNVAVTYTYKYDALGRLVKVVEPVNGDRQYDYDEAGNRTAVTEGGQ